MQQFAGMLANLSNAPPPLEVIKFAGDPKEYIRFVCRLRDQVLSHPISESKKLTRLMEYIDGRASEAVIRYEGMGPGALLDALNVVKARFRQPYKIIDAYINSIVRGPVLVSDKNKGLQKLADECESLKKTLEVNE